MAMQPQQQRSYPQQPLVLPKQDQRQPSTVSVCSSMQQQHRCRQQSQRTTTTTNSVKSKTSSCCNPTTTTATFSVVQSIPSPPPSPQSGGSTASLSSERVNVKHRRRRRTSGNSTTTTANQSSITSSGSTATWPSSIPESPLNVSNQNNRDVSKQRQTPVVAVANRSRINTEKDNNTTITTRSRPRKGVLKIHSQQESWMRLSRWQQQHSWRRPTDRHPPTEHPATNNQGMTCEVLVGETEATKLSTKIAAAKRVGCGNSNNAAKGNNNNNNVNIGSFKRLSTQTQTGQRRILRSISSSSIATSPTTHQGVVVPALSDTFAARVVRFQRVIKYYHNPSDAPLFGALGSLQHCQQWNSLAIYEKQRPPATNMILQRQRGKTKRRLLLVAPTTAAAAAAAETATTAGNHYRAASSREEPATMRGGQPQPQRASSRKESATMRGGQPQPQRGRSCLIGARRGGPGRSRSLSIPRRTR